MANFNGTICKSSSPFGFEMSAKTTKSKLFGKLASIPKSTSTFLRDILFRKSTALQIFSHWMWCLLTSNWIFAKKILWHQKQVFFYQVIHSELGIRIYHSIFLSLRSFESWIFNYEIRFCIQKAFAFTSLDSTVVYALISFSTSIPCVCILKSF